MYCVGRQLTGNIEAIVNNGFAIIGRCRRQYLLAYTRTVDKSLVHSHTRNMQSGTFYYLRSSKLLTQVPRS